MKDPDCVFCNIAEDKIVLKNEYAFAINDLYPHSKGHLLIIPFNHVEDFFDLPEEEQSEIMKLLNEAKKYSDKNHKPTGYNININNGASAGQIVMHAHIHLIPRYNSK